MNICTLGTSDGYEKRLLAVGDSHNNVWLDVYEQIAEDHDWRIDVAGRAGCSWLLPDAPARGTKESQEGCAVWRGAIADRVASDEYDGIISVASSKGTIEPGMSREESAKAQQKALVSAWGQRASQDVPILALRDNPIFPAEKFDCVAHRAADAAEGCGLPRDEALLETGVEEAVAQSENAHLIDLSDFECGPRVCDMVVGGVIVTRDGAHLTATFAQTLAPYLDRELTRVLG